MRMNDVFKKMLSVVLVLCMVFTWVLPANAYDAGFSFNLVSNDRVSANLIGKDAVQLDGNQTQYQPTDMVRVSIFLTKQGVLEAGFPVNDLAGNAEAMAYRDKLQNEQNAMVNKIEKAIDADLDVVWSLTLATNLISANVQYCKIEAISAVRGVKNVVIEATTSPTWQPRQKLIPIWLLPACRPVSTAAMPQVIPALAARSPSSIPVWTWIIAPLIPLHTCTPWKSWQNRKALPFLIIWQV